MTIHRSGVALATALTVLCMAARARDRRVVDTVIAGNAVSEAAHGYAGHDALSGIVDGKSYREARGWIRYALTTFDDTEVTLAWSFAPPAADGTNGTREYDVLVEDSLIATKKFGAPSSTSSPSNASLAASTTSSGVVEIVVPFSLTKGRTNIAVILRAHGGSTPALREVRVIQDHNEQFSEQFNEQLQNMDQSIGLNTGILVPHTPHATR